MSVILVMKFVHILFFIVLTFCWIWMLPLLIVGAVFSIPLAITTLTISVIISVTLQWWFHGQIIPNNILRRWISYCPWYEWFPCNTISISETSVVAVHPHGVLCCGALAGIHFVPESQTVFCVAPILFFVPVLGWCVRALGCIPARYDIMLLALRKGHSLIVVPGGVPELVMAEVGDDYQTFERSGFIRLAQEAQVPIQSVFIKGECQTYAMWKAPLHDKRVYLSWKLNVPLLFPFFCGWYGTWLPKRTPLVLKTQRIESTTKQEYYSYLKQLQQEI